MTDVQKAQNAQTLESAFEDLEAANTAVTNAANTLADAQAEHDAKVQAIKDKFEELKAKAADLGITVAANVEEAKQAVQEKLDEGKSKWAAEAQEDPNAARRKLRAIWGCIGLIAGLVIGGGAGYLYCFLA